VSAIAQVEPLTTARTLAGPFDYRLPGELQAGVGVGSMLLVPFGRRNVLGVVVGLADSSAVAEERLLVPRRALEQGVPADLVELARWIAAEYCSTFARALTLVLPPGAAHGTARTLQRLVAAPTAAGRSALRDPQVRLGDRQRAVLERLVRAGPLPAASAGLDHGTLRRLQKRGLVELEQRRHTRRPAHAAVGAAAVAPAALTAAQARALDELRDAIARRTHARLLLHGVTGSGKTEVYLGATEAALRAGRAAIVLVPEIALTPQLLTRFRSRFGDVVAVLHSRLSAGERHDEWRRLRDGEARVCVGPRSAVFAPLSELGLIVLDEEHDASYKHEGDPRYDARAVAERRAQQLGAVLLAGSATPRPESYHRLRRLCLPERVQGDGLPSVEVLDMRTQRGALHARTVAALADVRRERAKAIVLLNRRGWSNFLSCRACGRVWGCPECDVTLVLHRAERHLACHHCGYREAVPERCSECGSVSVARHGAGTERLEHELADALDDGGFPIFRLDADTLAARGGATEVLQRFGRAPAGVLLGTQMIAKGHDFPGVTLAVVLDADQTLRFPDFRAEERTFALVAQLAGRAGRGQAGHVLVQTLAPQAPAILAAARHDSDGFLAAELERRRALRYPPFAELIRIVCAAPQPGAAAAAAGELRARLATGLQLGCRRSPTPPDAVVLGPAPLFRLRGRDRSHLLVKAGRRDAAVAAVRAAVQATAADRRHRAVSFSVDVDPQ
jgi:primosomal protein N' (replication factor Y)